MFPSPNSNGYSFIDLRILIGNYSFGGLNITKEGYVSTLSICSLVTCSLLVFVVVVANDVVNVVDF
jgi:hypothetical protein